MSATKELYWDAICAMSSPSVNDPNEDAEYDRRDRERFETWKIGRPEASWTFEQFEDQCINADTTPGMIMLPPDDGPFPF